MSVHDRNRTLLAPLRSALSEGGESAIRHALDEVFAPGARISLGHPLGTMQGPDNLWTGVYAQLLAALPDLERCDFIAMAGSRMGDDRGGNWVGLGGNFIGTFARPWLGIPATGRPAFMRYHEYFRIEDDRIVEMKGLWDIPQLMLQAAAWPMAPQLGVEWMCPGPADGKGVVTEPYDAGKADRTVKIVRNMLHDLKQGDARTPDRGLAGFWHPKCLWYGPTGIGSARGHAGVSDVVLKSFRRGLTDNVRELDKGVFFGDHDLVAFTGWPSAEATHSGDGFLGLAPTNRRFNRRSLDFWRIENGLIRENWVMVDMIDVYRQLGVDIFARMASYCGISVPGQDAA